MRLSQKAQNEAVPAMAIYCIALLKVKQKHGCADCGGDLLKLGYQIDHIRYAEDITLYDLQLLCGVCHARKTGVKGVNGTLRRV